MTSPVGWRERLRASSTVYALSTTQALFATAYVLFWLSDGPTHSDLQINLEYYSFFVVPFMWLAFLLADVWLIRQPLAGRDALVVQSGLVVTAVCLGAALAVAAVFVISDLILAITGF